MGYIPPKSYCTYSAATRWQSRHGRWHILVALPADKHLAYYVPTFSSRFSTTWTQDDAVCRRPNKSAKNRRACRRALRAQHLDIRRRPGGATPCEPMARRPRLVPRRGRRHALQAGVRSAPDTARPARARASLPRPPPGAQRQRWHAPDEGRGARRAPDAGALVRQRTLCGGAAEAVRGRGRARPCVPEARRSALQLGRGEELEPRRATAGGGRLEGRPDRVRAGHAAGARPPEGGPSWSR